MSEPDATMRFPVSSQRKTRMLLLQVGVLILVAPAMCVMVAAIGFMITAMTSMVDTKAGPIFAFLTAFIGCIVVLAVIVPLILAVTSMLSLFRTYLEVSPEGVVYDYWGQMRVNARWEDISHIGPYGPFNYVAMHLRDADVKEPLIYQWRRAFYRNPYPILIGLFEGWPDGELAGAISRYAPHLMEEYTRGTHTAR